MTRKDAASVARAAWAAVPKTEKPPQQQPRERAETIAFRRRAQLADLTLAASPLSVWFPGEDWAVMAHGRPGASAQFVGDGLEAYVAPADRSFTLWLDGTEGVPQGRGLPPSLPRNVRVAYVRWVEPLACDSEGYWAETAVTSPADIGRELEKDDENDRVRKARGERPRRRT